MQVWGNYLKNIQAQSKWLGYEFGVQAVVEFIFNLLYLNLIEIFVDFRSHKITISRKLYLKFKFYQKTSEVSGKKIAKVLQLLLSLYKWFILLKIPCKLY